MCLDAKLLIAEPLFHSFKATSYLPVRHSCPLGVALQCRPIKGLLKGQPFLIKLGPSEETNEPVTGRPGAD
jgi:hypothetical protein